jgi:hypothetical protein
MMKRSRYVAQEEETREPVVRSEMFPAYEVLMENHEMIEVA